MRCSDQIYPPSCERRRARGHQVHIHRWTGNAPTILGLHGFTGTGDDFRALATYIDNSFLAPDLIGHGRSDAPPENTSYNIGSVAAMNALLFDGCRFLLGYSLGARIALEMVIDAAVQPRALILIGGTAGIADPEERRDRCRADDRRALEIRTSGVSTFLEHWQRTPLIATQDNAPATLRTVMAEGRKLFGYFLLFWIKMLFLVCIKQGESHTKAQKWCLRGAFDASYHRQLKRLFIV